MANSDQIYNTQNSDRTLDPQVGNYQSSYSGESWVFQEHSATMSALWLSKIYHFSPFYFLGSS